MSHPTRNRIKRHLHTVRARFASGEQLAFAELLPAEKVDAALRQEGIRWRLKLFTPLVTLWAFLTQLSSPDRCCRAVVSRVLAWLVSRGQTPAAVPTTGGYCKARARLPESLLRRLARDTGRDLCTQAQPAWLWRGRRVKVVDGTTVSMPDTEANQNEYPQPDSQKPGLGFPIARVVAVFCLSTGAVLNAALGRYRGKQTGETALLRQVTDSLEPGDVVLGDRGFGSYCELALWRARGVDAVVRMHQARRADFRSGVRLGHNDHLVNWHRPARPEWMDEATYASIPATLGIREVEVQLEQKGFRTQRLVVVTTLTDAKLSPASALAELYRARWNAELDLRSLKCAMGLDVLRCKTPQMVRKEFWMHLLAYNLVRGVMRQAARQEGCDPRSLSFTGAWQAVQSFAARLCEASVTRAAELLKWLLRMVGSQKVGKRPNRVEPRARKRRPKPGAYLMKPRKQAQAELLSGVGA